MSPYILYALVVAVCAGIVPSLHFGRGVGNIARRAVLQGGVTFVVALAVGYLFTPFFYGPFWGLTSSLLAFGIANTVIAMFMVSNFDGYRDKFNFPHGGWVVLAFIVLVLCRGCAGSGMFQADDYRAILGEVESRNWTEDMQPVDATHIRPVSMAQAEWLGNKVIGEAEGSLGSRYNFGDYAIQRVNGELYWVAPLEFLGFAKWQTYGHTTGFVMVSVEDRNRRPEFFDGFEFRYMPSAFFGDNLTRHLYTSGYEFRGLTEYSFEVDDNLKPWWVITVFHPTIQWSGVAVDGVIIVDPETGEILPGQGDIYKPEEVPGWVDRVYPEEFVETYITWWGKFIKGWVNSWWQKEGVEVPTPFGGDANDVLLVYGEDGQPKWFTGLTSASSTDQSLTGFMLVDSRTGQAAKYRISGPNEEAVLEAVNNAVSNFEGWHGTTPIPYNIYGEFTWGVPVVSESNIFQRMSFVRQSSATVVLGESVQDALRKYRSALASGGFSVAPTADADIRTLEGVRVTRIGTEPSSSGVIYYLYFDEEPTKGFTAPSGISPELPFTQVGDSVTASYVETMEPHVPLESFDNRELDLRVSESQQELNERRGEVEGEREIRDTRREVRRDLEDLSPDELLELEEVLQERRAENDG